MHYEIKYGSLDVIAWGHRSFRSFYCVYIYIYIILIYRQIYGYLTTVIHF